MTTPPNITAAELDRMEALLAEPEADDTLEPEHGQCAKCGDCCIVAVGHDFEDGVDWCWQCSADAWNEWRVHAPALIAAARRAESQPALLAACKYALARFLHGPERITNPNDEILNDLRAAIKLAEPPPAKGTEEQTPC